MSETKFSSPESDGFFFVWETLIMGIDGDISPLREFIRGNSVQNNAGRFGGVPAGKYAAKSVDNFPNVPIIIVGSIVILRGKEVEKIDIFPCHRPRNQPEN